MTDPRFHDHFVRLFDTNYPRLFRYLDRLSGDPDLAADLAQEVFVRLYRRASVPDQPQAWLITVALNLFRNAKSTRARRLRLLTDERGARGQSDPPAPSDQEAEAGEARTRVRATLERLPARDRSLLLLRAEGYGYREMAVALEINEASIGTLLARAKRAFKEAYETANAPF